MVCHSGYMALTGIVPGLNIMEWWGPSTLNTLGAGTVHSERPENCRESVSSLYLLFCVSISEPFERFSYQNLNSPMSVRYYFETLVTDHSIVYVRTAYANGFKMDYRLQCWDVCPDPGSKRLRIPDPYPHKRQSIFNLTYCSKLSEIWSGIFILDPDPQYW